MKYFLHTLLIAITIFPLSSCFSNCDSNEDTSIARVHIITNDNGTPEVDVDPVIVKPGQLIIYTGPARFSLTFLGINPETAEKGDKTFDSDGTGKIKFIVSERFQEKTEIKYSVTVNGITLDPIMIVLPE